LGAGVSIPHDGPVGLPRSVQVVGFMGSGDPAFPCFPRSGVVWLSGCRVPGLSPCRTACPDSGVRTAQNAQNPMCLVGRAPLVNFSGVSESETISTLPVESPEAACASSVERNPLSTREHPLNSASRALQALREIQHLATHVIEKRHINQGDRSPRVGSSSKRPLTAH
jgi:hypothetical protein